MSLHVHVRITVTLCTCVCMCMSVYIHVTTCLCMLSQVQFSPEDFQAVMQLLDSLKDGRDDTGGGKAAEEGEGVEPKSDKSPRKEKDEGKDAGRGPRGEVVTSSSGGGVSDEFRVRAAIGEVNLLLHSAAKGEVLSVAVHGMYMCLFVYLLYCCCFMCTLFVYCCCCCCLFVAAVVCLLLFVCMLFAAVVCCCLCVCCLFIVAVVVCLLLLLFVCLLLLLFVVVVVVCVYVFISAELSADVDVLPDKIGVKAGYDKGL